MVKLLIKNGNCMETDIGQAAGWGGSVEPLLSLCHDDCSFIVRTFRGYVGNQQINKRRADSAYCLNDSKFSRNGHGWGETK